MSSETLFSSSQAAKAAGISAGSLRNYAQGGRFGAFYAPYLSAGAAPGPGQARQFSGSDIAVLRFIRSRTAQGVSHETIAAELAAGALESFDWQPPEESAAEARAARQAQEETQAVDGWGRPARKPTEAETVALAVTSQWAPLLEMANARADRLQDRVSELERELGRAEGELSALKTAQGRPWYKRLFGG